MNKTTNAHLGILALHDIENSWTCSGNVRLELIGSAFNLESATLLKNELQRRCFSVSFSAKSSGTHFYKHISLNVFRTYRERAMARNGLNAEVVVRRCSVKSVSLKISQNWQENTCASISFLIKLHACNFIEKETLAQVIFCEFCEISKNTFFYRTPPVAASVNILS